MSIEKVKVCLKCKGKGTIRNKKCAICQGKGKIRVKEIENY